MPDLESEDLRACLQYAFLKLNYIESEVAVREIGKRVQSSNFSLPLP